MKHLVIVESPTKARTIGRYLGDEYVIKFSMGHVIDLPKSKLGVAVDDHFKPEYQVLEDKKKIISDLKAAAKGAKVVILATDPDREGEAIAADIKTVLIEKTEKKIEANAKSEEVLDESNTKYKRIVFHEITESAVKEAINHPRDIDINLVNAQTARRVLDRLVGYKLSPMLWRKVRRGLSAGRVQSVALRLIVEREREIEKFKKEPYYTITVVMVKDQKSNSKDQKEDPVEFELIEIRGEKIEKQQTLDLYDGQYKTSKTILSTLEKADGVLEDISRSSFTVAETLEKETRRSPFAPYITSTLQQDAARRFGLSGKRTMGLAQKLYEEGFITYHRTDSYTISQSAISAIRSFVASVFGEQYVSPQQRIYTTKQKTAQEAHEGIRPTKIDSLETGQFKKVQQELGRDYAKLYEMIWRRAVSSQMADSVIESTSVFVDTKGTSGDPYRLKTNGSVLKFEGFLKVNPQALQDTRLPKYTVGETLNLLEKRADAHETQPPPRYNDASIIATLEEKGIGRPSTYASIISTIVDRSYVDREEKKFIPTPVGIAVNDFLVENFSDIDDVPFTAEMEDKLDKIANGEQEWEAMMKEFYGPFEKKLEKVGDAARVKIEVEETDEQCPECKQSNLVVRTGKFGKFLSCGRFPDCKFTKPFVEETDLTCPKDGGKIVVRKTRKGRKFFGCSNYPNCDYAAWKVEDIKKSGATGSAGVVS